MTHQSCTAPNPHFIVRHKVHESTTRVEEQEEEEEQEQEEEEHDEGGA